MLKRMDEECALDMFKNQEPPKRRCGWNRVLVELDGSHIRTGILTPLETEEFTPLRHIRRCKRQTDWREVRVGFARPVEQKEKWTFVARMGQYPEVVQQLHSAAVDQGLSTYTLVFPYPLSIRLSLRLACSGCVDSPENS
jgi:hypothetical protein